MSSAPVLGGFCRSGRRERIRSTYSVKGNFSRAASVDSSFSRSDGSSRLMFIILTFYLNRFGA
jgi:hypothetical protein